MSEKIIFLNNESLIKDYNNKLPPGKWRKYSYGYINIAIENKIKNYNQYYKNIANYKCGCKLQIHLQELHYNIKFCSKHTDLSPDQWECGCSIDRWGVVELCKFHESIYLQLEQKIKINKG